jgi:hypothetical protein
MSNAPSQHGVLYVAYGDPARREAAASIASLRRWHPDWPVAVVSDEPWSGGGVISIMAPDADPGARWAKLNLNTLAPAQWRHILYLDADTLVRQPLDAGFAILADGWDLALTFSENQRGMALGCQDLLWHVGQRERDVTIDELGNPFPLQLQCGVMFVNRTERTARLFAAWREEWQRWRGMDQGAFLRALERAPVRLWLLGRCWNAGGSVGGIIEHRFGCAARKGLA